MAANDRKSFSPRAAWIALILSSLIVVWAVFGEEGVYQGHQLRREIAQIQERVTNLTRENLELKLKLLQFQDSVFWAEKIAREQLELVRPEERTYRFHKSQPPGSQINGGKTASRF